jgi:hypothetical protein
VVPRKSAKTAKWKRGASFVAENVTTFQKIVISAFVRIVTGRNALVACQLVGASRAVNNSAMTVKGSSYAAIARRTSALTAMMTLHLAKLNIANRECALTAMLCSAATSAASRSVLSAKSYSSAMCATRHSALVAESRLLALVNVIILFAALNAKLRLLAAVQNARHILPERRKNVWQGRGEIRFVAYMINNHRLMHDVMIRCSVLLHRRLEES